MPRSTPVVVLALAWSLVAAADPAGAATIKVETEDMSFSPAQLTIHRGDIVRFSNNSYGTHVIRSRSAGQSFALGPLQSGEEREHAFNQPGDVTVSCDIHPRMIMTIHVE